MNDASAKVLTARPAMSQPIEKLWIEGAQGFREDDARHGHRFGAIRTSGEGQILYGVCPFWLTQG